MAKLEESPVAGARGTRRPTVRRGVPHARLRRGWRSASLMAGIATAAIMVEPHNPIQLPGHRALGWLALLFMMRLACGPGWATLVGIASAAGTLAIGRSPNGSVWGVLQYAVAALGVEAFLSPRRRTASPLLLAGAGAAILALVGWITPISNSIVGGASARDVWLSLSAIPAASWGRLLAFDVAFGVAAGLIGLAAARAVSAAALLLPSGTRGQGQIQGLRKAGHGPLLPHSAKAEDSVPGVGCPPDWVTAVQPVGVPPVATGAPPTLG